MQIILLNNFTLIADDRSMSDWLLSQLTDMQVNDYTTCRLNDFTVAWATD